jgi:aryl sulfotransferase
VRYRGLVYDTDRWAAYRHRPGDIVISTPPKCGTTWMQNIVGMLLLDTTSFDRPMKELSPWFDQLLHDLDATVGDLEARDGRRWLKAHAPLDALPWHETLTYVVVGRDPRDVAVSMDHHITNMDMKVLLGQRAEAVGLEDLTEHPPPPETLEDPAERWWRWVTIRSESEFAWGLQYLLIHLGSFWERRHEPNVVMLHYADLERDLIGEMRRLGKRLGVDVDDERLREMAAAATFDAMRTRASDLAPNAGMWRSDEAFFRSGGSGHWRALVGEDAMDRYFASVRELTADEELISWLHRP